MAFYKAAIERHLGSTIASYHGGNQINEGGGLGRIVTCFDGESVYQGSSTVGKRIAYIDGNHIREPSSTRSLAQTSSSRVGEYRLDGSPSPILAAALFMAARLLNK